MSFLHFIWLYLWVVPHALLAVVAALMFRRRWHKDFPIFFTYTVFEFLQFCLLFSIYLLGSAPSLYWKIDIFLRAGSIALRFGILQELFESPFAHNLPAPNSVRRVLNWVTALMVVLAAVFIGLLYYGSVRALPFPVYLTNQVLNVSQCGLILLVFLWHRFLGYRMTPMAFGIALGMGLVAGFEPLVRLLKDFLPASRSVLADFVVMSVYHGAVLFWVYFASVKDRVTTAPDANFVMQVSEELSTIHRTVDL